MRIRRKKNFNDRFNLVKDYVIVAERDILNQKDAIKDKKYFDFKALFGNDNPVCLEIGCGKGAFIIDVAKKNPNLNFLAVELLDNIVLMAGENAKQENVNNLKFFNCGADYLPRYIKKNSIDKIFLNFSPPYPGKSYENRRLTYTPLSKFYFDSLVGGGTLYQKTDDVGFFEYSVEKLSDVGFNVEILGENVENIEFINVQTEYETKFRNLGVKINSLIAKKSL